MPEPSEQESIALKSAKRRVLTRLVLFLLVAFTAVWAVLWAWPGIHYALYGGELRNIGDVRALRASGVKTLDVSPGSYVRFENLMVTRPATGTRFNYFYCPIYSILVRTNQPIPELTGRVIEASVPEGLEYLLQDRIVSDPAIFALHADVQGWLIPLREVPGFRGAVGDYIRQTLGLTPEQIDRSFALLDGESPEGHRSELWILGGAIIAVIVSLVGLTLSIRAWRRMAVA